MRTTITLEDDVAARLRDRARKTGRSFKDSVNEAIRVGLELEVSAEKLPPFSIDADHLFRLRSGFNYDKVEDVFDSLDSPSRIR